MRINIISGEAMASYDKELGFKSYIPFCESMVSGNVTEEEPFGQKFVALRSDVLSVPTDKYRKKFVNQLLKIRSGDDVHVYFGEDMFCQLNLITLLAYLERIGVPSVTYHVVFEDEMKETALLEGVETSGFGEVYKAVLVRHETTGTNIEITDKGIMLYSDYLDDNGRIASFIKSNPEDTVLQLTVKLIKQFAEYGLGDTQSAELIARVRKTAECSK